MLVKPRASRPSDSRCILIGCDGYSCSYKPLSFGLLHILIDSNLDATITIMGDPDDGDGDSHDSVHRLLRR